MSDGEGVPGWEGIAKRPEAAGCPRCVLSLGLGCLVWLTEAQQQQQHSSVSCKPADDAGGLIIIEIITVAVDVYQAQCMAYALQFQGLNGKHWSELSLYASP